MYFKLSLLTMTVGIMIAGLVGFLPHSLIVTLPEGLGLVTTMIGLMIAFLGWFLLRVRAKKTGAIHIIHPAVKNAALWFYVFKDDEIMITPAVRIGEGLLKSNELDAEVFDAKTYTLADHKVRIVPEVIGHAVDLDYVLYVNLLKSKYGFENLREARKGIVKKEKEIVSEENVATGREIEKVLSRRNE